MRLVVTSDTHFGFNNESGLIPDGDVLIHCGDVMYTGYPDEWYDVVKSFGALPHKHKYLVPGNHDFHIQNYEGIAKAELRRQAKTKVILPNDPIVTLPNGMTVMGVPFVTGLYGWAYCRGEEWLLDWLKGWDFVPDIMVTHAPVFGVLDAVDPDADTVQARQCVGSLAYNRWLLSLDKPPSFWFCGHIHESYGEVHMNGCSFYNVAMCDRNYKQVNQAVVLDL